MRRSTSVLLTLAGVTVLGAGCANQKQWNDWNRHSTHFASEEHLWFSLTHQTPKTPPGVTRKDLDTARGQSWWGEQLAVRARELSR